jgi:hypothetical protein
MTMPGFDPEFASAAEWARLYRFCSIQVVPAFMPGEARGANWKRPLLKNWKQYQDQLVSDEVFDQWYGPLGQYRQRPNMGTICGNASSNLMVVDLDVYKKPDALRWWLNLLELHNARLELETVEQRTGGGGLQKLFHCPPGWAPPTCKTPIGIDIRGQGGFAMLCPSVHESGKAYEWLEGRSPDDIEILMAPDWLLEAVEALVVEHGGSAGVSHETRQRGANGQGRHEAGTPHDGRAQRAGAAADRCGEVPGLREPGVAKGVRPGQDQDRDARAGGSRPQHVLAQDPVRHEAVGGQDFGGCRQAGAQGACGQVGRP